MLVGYIILTIILLMIYIYIGLNLSKNIEGDTTNVLFWALYIIVFMVIINILMVSNFWATIQNKTGPPGPRGLMGDKGKTGEKGSCDEDCRNIECSITLIPIIEEELRKLEKPKNPDITKLSKGFLKNTFILNKIKQMCHSKQYTLLSETKGPKNLNNYLSQIWREWTQIIYESGGIDFFMDTEAEIDYLWKGENPFKELEKYDVFYWGLTRDFKPLDIEVCYDPLKTNHVPGGVKGEIKVLTTNIYNHVYSDWGTGADWDLTIWKPRIAIYNNEMYYPVGYVATRMHALYASNKFLKDGDKIIQTYVGNIWEGPSKNTIIVTGDVKPPIGYRWKWNDEDTGGDWDVGFWSPIAPPGYVCLGDVVRPHAKWIPPGIGRDAPIVCVPKKCVSTLVNRAYRVWWDRGSGGDYDGSIMGYNHGFYGEWSHENAYNLFRCWRGYPSTISGSYFYKLNFKCSTDTNISSIKTKDDKNTDIAIGWHGSPARDLKYSIFNYLGIMPESIITNASTGRKYYLVHSGAMKSIEGEEFRKTIPQNSYVVLKPDEDVNGFVISENNNYNMALSTVGNTEVETVKRSDADIRQLWEIEFVDKNNDAFRLKSKENGRYLWHSVMKNLRGKPIEKIVNIGDNPKATLKKINIDYYNTAIVDAKEPNLSKLKPYKSEYLINSAINWDWGNNKVLKSGKSDRVALRIKTNIKPILTGEYEFKIVTDDGVRLSIDNKMLIDDWKVNKKYIQILRQIWTFYYFENKIIPKTIDTGKISLKENISVPLVIDWFDYTGNASLKLFWKPPGRNWQIIPSNNLIDFTELSNIGNTRYINIKCPNWYLQLAEVEAYTYETDALGNKTEVNVALNKYTRQSSTGWGGYSSYAVNGITDGNFNKNKTTHTNNAPPTFWEVDLGAEYKIHKLVIYNRTDCCGGRLMNSEIKLLDSVRNTVEFVNYGNPIAKKTFTFKPQTNNNKSVITDKTIFVNNKSAFGPSINLLRNSDKKDDTSTTYIHPNRYITGVYDPKRT